MFATLLIVVILFIITLVIYKAFMQKEHFSTCYDSSVMEEMSKGMINNNNIIEKQNSFVKHFSNNYYNADEIDQVMSKDRSELQQFESSVSGTLNRYRDQLSKFTTNEAVQSQYLNKVDYEKSLFPFVKQSNLQGHFDKHLNDMDTIFYRADMANDTFMKMGALDDYYNSVENVSTNIDIVSGNIKHIGESLHKYETKENIKGTYVQVPEFDKVKDAVNKYKSDVDDIQGLIDDSRLIYDATSKTMTNRFDAFNKELENIKQQQSYIKNFIQDKNNDINTEQVFAYQKDFTILQGDTRILEESARNIDNRVDSVETGLIEMTKKLCVGEECLQYADVKDLKSIVKVYKSTYEQEQDLIENIQTDMIGYQEDIAILKKKLEEEIQIRTEMGEMHTGEMQKMRDKLIEDNRVMSESYQKWINRIEKQKKEYKNELDAYLTQNYNVISTRNAEVHEMQNMITALESQLTNITNEKVAITTRLNELINAYEDENGGYNKRMQEKTEAIKQLSSELDNASSYLSRNQQIIDDVKMELSNTKAELRVCSSSLQDKTSESQRLMADVGRINTLYSTGIRGNMALQEEIVQCNTDRLKRVTVGVHDLVKEELKQCDLEKNNEYISHTELGAYYMLKSDHVNNCVMKNTLETDFVPYATYLSLLNEINDPVKFMKMQDVFSNYTSNSEHAKLQNEYNTNCIKKELLASEKSKVARCEDDKDNNYTSNVIMNDLYTTKINLTSQLDAEKRKCEVDKQRNYVHKTLHNAVVREEENCKTEQTTNYVPREQYEETYRQKMYCEDDKQSNYLLKSYVQQYYKSNNDYSRDIATEQKKCESRLSDYISKQDVDLNYVSKTFHNALLLQQQTQFDKEIYSIQNSRTTLRKV